MWQQKQHGTHILCKPQQINSTALFNVPVLHMHLLVLLLLLHTKPGSKVIVCVKQ
jgi:hypothetical protein